MNGHPARQFVRSGDIVAMAGIEMAAFQCLYRRGLFPRATNGAKGTGYRRLFDPEFAEIFAALCRCEVPPAVAARLAMRGQAALENGCVILRPHDGAHGPILKGDLPSNKAHSVLETMDGE